MSTLELPHVASAVLRLRTKQIVNVEMVLPIEVQVRRSNSNSDADTKSVDNNTNSKNSPPKVEKLATAGKAMAIYFEKAYLCLGQSSIWLLDLQLADLMKPSMALHGFSYTKIERIEIQTPRECKLSFCLQLKHVKIGAWCPFVDRIFFRVGEREQVIHNIQLLWSISFAQTFWRVPTGSDVVVEHDISWPKRRSRVGENYSVDTDDDQSLMYGVCDSGATVQPEKEAFEQLGDYLFYLPKVS